MKQQQRAGAMKPHTAGPWHSRTSGESNTHQAIVMTQAKMLQLFHIQCQPMHWIQLTANFLLHHLVRILPIYTSYNNCSFINCSSTKSKHKSNVTNTLLQKHGSFVDTIVLPLSCPRKNNSSLHHMPPFIMLSLHHHYSLVKQAQHSPRLVPPENFNKQETKGHCKMRQ